MTKQQFILKMLDTLGEDRPLSKGIRVLVESNAFSDKVIDGLLIIFQSGVNSAMTDVQLNKLKNGITLLKKLQATKAKENEITTQEAIDLDAELAKL